jgi:hypothetical protein
VSTDAVIVLPGIMGSELVDAASGTPLWGLADPGWYVKAWTTGSSLSTLRVTDEERAGRAGRIRATGLLRFPAVAPVLRGFEPYTDLVAGLRQQVSDQAAVLPFPYDWRLPVAYNAHRLADAADRHLRRWRAHPRGSASARLVLVAHSMGGLIARYFTGVLGGARDVRTTITLGTPLRGSVKAAYILNSGRGAPVPLPSTRLRHLLESMPGIHDLLPSYRCVTDGTGARRLTPSDVAGLGGDPELAASAAALHEQLAALGGDGLRTVVGVRQPTMQSMRLDGGVVVPQQWAYLPDPGTGEIRTLDRGGDGTVYREAAAGETPLYLAQTHGALARTPEAITHVRAVLTEEPLGAWLGEPPPLGLQTPDIAATGVAFGVTVTGTADPAAATCRVEDATTGVPVGYPVLLPAGGALAAQVTVGAPGVYRVAVKGEAFSPVTQLVLVTP